MAKKAMMKVTDLPNDLCFSAYHRLNGDKDGKKIEYERKTNDKDEAAILFRMFKGQTMTLGQVRKKILIHTPFVYHTRALKVLEDRLLIVNVETRPGEKRNMGTFRFDVPMTTTQDDSLKRKYGNHWKLTFADEILGNCTQLFLHNPEENGLFFAHWIEEKLRCRGGRMTNDKLWKAIPTKLKNKPKRKVRRSDLNGVLKLMVGRKVIEKKKGRASKTGRLFWRTGEESNQLIPNAMS